MRYLLSDLTKLIFSKAILFLDSDLVEIKGKIRNLNDWLTRRYRFFRC